MRRVADRRELRVRRHRAGLGVERNLDRGGAPRAELLDGGGRVLGTGDRASRPGRRPRRSHRIAVGDGQHRARRSDQRTVERRELGEVGQREDAVRGPPQVADRGHAAGKDRGRIREPDVDVPVGRRRHHDAVGGHDLRVVRNRMDPADGRDHAPVQIDLDVGREPARPEPRERCADAEVAHAAKATPRRPRGAVAAPCGAPGPRRGAARRTRTGGPSRPDASPPRALGSTARALRWASRGA